ACACACACETAPKSPRQGFSSFNFRALRESLARRFSSSVSTRKLKRRAASTADNSAKYPERHSLSAPGSIVRVALCACCSTAAHYLQSETCRTPCGEKEL